MIDRDHGLPLRRQAEALQLSRSTLYYEPALRANDDETLSPREFSLEGAEG